MDSFYAYGEEYAGLEAVMRFQAVKRWHMIDTTRQQTLAEHSGNVALLAFYIATTAPAMFFGPAAPIAAYALVHDIEETFLGDTPSHTKKYLQGLDALEEAVVPKLFKIEHTTNIRTLVKMCDIADGIRFIRLHGVDVTSRHAREGLERQMEFWRSDIKDNWPSEVCLKVNRDTGFYAYELS